MSDYYISKNLLIEELQKRIGGDLDCEDVEYLEKIINSIPAVKINNNNTKERKESVESSHLRILGFNVCSEVEVNE